MNKIPVIRILHHQTIINIRPLFRNIPSIYDFDPRKDEVLTKAVITDCLRGYTPDDLTPLRTYANCMTNYKLDPCKEISHGRLLSTGTRLSPRNAQLVYERITKLIRDGVVDPTLTNIMNGVNPFDTEGWYIGKSTRGKAASITAKVNSIIVGHIRVQVNGKTYSYARYRDEIFHNYIKKHHRPRLTKPEIDHVLNSMRGVEIANPNIQIALNRFDDVFAYTYRNRILPNGLR